MPIAFGWWDHFERLRGLPLSQQYLDRIEMVQLAERLGFDSYLVAEHHLSDLDLAPSPLMFLAALAQRTSRIRLGSMVLCLPLYQPVRLLQELCMVDQLSQGRLDPGIGRGVRDVDHIWLGSDPTDSRARFDETLEVLRQGLDTGRLDHKGKYFEFDDLEVRFDAVQQPLRFWYVGNHKFAAENGMSCLGPNSREAIDEYWRIFSAGRARGDRRFQGPDPKIGSLHRLYLAETDEEARVVARRAFRVLGDNFWSTPVIGEGVTYPKGSLKVMGGDYADEMMEAGVLLAGSPETVVRRLVQVAEQAGPGLNFMAGVFQWGDMTRAEATSSMTLFHEHIMPRLRALSRELAI